MEIKTSEMYSKNSFPTKTYEYEEVFGLSETWLNSRGLSDLLTNIWKEIIEEQNSTKITSANDAFEEYSDITNNNDVLSKLPDRFIKAMRIWLKGKISKPNIQTYSIEEIYNIFYRFGLEKIPLDALNIIKNAYLNDFSIVSLEDKRFFGHYYDELDENDYEHEVGEFVRIITEYRSGPKRVRNLKIKILK